MGWDMGWDLSSRERWDEAHARGRGAWVRRKMAPLCLTSVPGLFLTHRHFGSVALSWSMAAALVYVVLFTAWLLRRTYDNAERLHRARAKSPEP